MHTGRAFLVAGEEKGDGSNNSIEDQEDAEVELQLDAEEDLSASTEPADVMQCLFEAVHTYVSCLLQISASAQASRS
jgi:hypothetical protein